MTRFDERRDRCPSHRARGYVLIYILALMPLLAVIVTLAYQGVHSILRAQRAATTLTNELLVLNDWLEALREDTRRAATLTLDHVGEPEPRARLELNTDRGRVLYAIADNRIERTEWVDQRPAQTQRWTPRSMSIEISTSSASRGELLLLDVEWKRVSRRRLEEPVRRFETSFLVGERYAP